METMRLNNGVEIPMLGFGTYQVKDPEVGSSAFADIHPDAVFKISQKIKKAAYTVL